MIAINSINHFPVSRLRLQNKPAADLRSEAARLDEPVTPNPLETLSVHQLPEEPAYEIADIVRRIGTRAHQAAELGQTFSNRELLQEGITEDIENLKTVFAKLSEDHLILIAALFQNQPVTGPAFSDRGRDPFIADLALDGFVENFFRIDVTSQTGSLAAVDLTGTVIDILSARDSESRFLDSLLDQLTDSIFTRTLIEDLELDQDESTTQQERDINRVAAQNQYITPIQADSNPPTIIDMFG